MLVLSKIDYGLPIYGHSPKTNLNIIKPTYHQSARACTYALRTTPIENILCEANLPSIEERIKDSRLRILPKLLYSKNSPLNKDISSSIAAKKPKRIQSAIALTLNLCSTLNLQPVITKNRITQPPWKYNSTSADLSLAKHCKSNTAKNVFLSHFLEQKNYLENNNWRIMYTDGTKSQNSIPAYAVVNEAGNALTLSILCEQSSVFTAEACAIYAAIRLILTDKKKTAIFTDSLSVINAINNPLNYKWNTILKIRDAMANNSNLIRIHWIPSHIGILGNERADTAAKFASYAPLKTDSTIEKMDIHRCITSLTKLKYRQKKISHAHYASVNPCITHPIYPTTTEKQKIIIFSRLRLGHTRFSHGWILQRPQTPARCSHCKSTLTIKHILLSCAHFSSLRHNIFGNASAFELLKDPSPSNINKIYNFIKLTKLRI